MSEADQTGFKIFRAADAADLMEEGCMTMLPMTPIQRDGMTKLVQAGYLHGAEVKVLVNIPGYSLTHVWFKAGYPLPLHSHDADCLYYIVAGDLRLGTETLGPRDSFFIPKDTPYTYRPGASGVELLEMRQASRFHFRTLANGEAFWSKAADAVAEHQDAWQTASRPTADA